MQKIILLIISVLLPIQAFAATAQVNDVCNYGGNVALNSAASQPVGVAPAGSVSKLVVLTASVNSATGGNILRFYQSNPVTANAQYYVPPNKHYKACGAMVKTGTASSVLQWGFKTAPFNDDIAGPTADSNNVYYGGSNTGKNSIGTQADTASAGQNIWYPIPVEFPPAVFPFVQTNTATSFYVSLIGYEY